MENQDKKELIKGIAELLQSHEEPYESGAWENFVVYKKKKRKPALYWISGVAAAITLIMASVLLLNRQPSPQQLPVQELAKEQKSPAKTEYTAPELAIVEPAKQSTLPSGIHEIDQEAKVTQSTSNAVVIPVAEEKTSIHVVAEPSEPAVNTVAGKPTPTSTAEEFFRNETKQLANVETRQLRPSRWKFGIEIAPMLSESNMNLGAGVSTEYQLTAKLSISSGISVLSLGAEKPVDNQPVSLMSNKKLTAVDANLTAIDIPLAVTYHLNKNLFTSVGVSYLNILSDKRTNNYVTEMALSQMVANPETGIVQAKETRIVEKKIEPADQSSLERGSYLGFFNLSVGHEQPINKKDHIVIEPFLKIPVGKLSSDELKFSNGGIKLRYSF